jgi:hypothetical protein
VILFGLVFSDEISNSYCVEQISFLYGYNMHEFHSSAYGPVVAELLKGGRGAMPLDAGHRDVIAGEALGRLSATELFPDGNVADLDMAVVCLSALWLRFGFLDESHRLSQRVDGVEGSYWHALMHRREGDFWNSKYWLRRVGNHPVYVPLQKSASEIAGSGDGPAARAMAAQKTWVPAGFAELCEIAVRNGTPDDPLWCRIQLAEWELLFDHCWRSAAGTPPLGE